MKRELLFDMQYTARLFGDLRSGDCRLARALFKCYRRKPLDERFETRILEREAKILERQYRDRPST